MVFSQNVVFSHSDQPSSQEPEQRALATGKKACESEQTHECRKEKGAGGIGHKTGACVPLVT